MNELDSFTNPKKDMGLHGVDNYIDLPVLDNLMPVSMRIKLPKESNWFTTHPIIQYGKKKLTYETLRKYIKDEEYHHISWDGETLQIDGKSHKLPNEVKKW